MHVPGIRTRVTIAVVLGICALGLVAAERFTSAANGRPRQLRMEKETVQSIVNDVLTRSGVDKKQVKTWQVRLSSGNGVRTEQRIIVPRDFVSVTFNHELSRALAPYGARVIATERTKEQTVTMHIISEGEVIHTLSLQTR